MYKHYRADMKLKIAAKRLGISDRTLMRYEAGEVTVPCDVVTKMAAVYQDPKLLMDHCSLKCQIGELIHQYLDKSDLGNTVLRFMKELDDVVNKKSQLVEIAYDGRIDKNELFQWQLILKEMHELKKAINELEQFASMDYIHTLNRETKKEPAFAQQAL